MKNYFNKELVMTKSDEKKKLKKLMNLLYLTNCVLKNVLK